MIILLAGVGVVVAVTIVVITCPDCDWSFPGTVHDGIPVGQAIELIIPVIEDLIHSHQHQEDL